jgi:hypothetical protein
MRFLITLLMCISFGLAQEINQPGGGGGTAFSIITDNNTARTLGAGDNGKGISFTSSSAVTVTVPTGLTVGYTVTLIQSGTGTISFSPTPTAGSCTPGASSCVQSPQGFTTSCAQWGSVKLISVATDRFVIMGCLK